jgi:quercetin dioxygenase-like cupin family protein
MHLNTHSGQEFNLVLEGALQLRIAGNDIVLNEGDSIYFDATKPHGMKALNGNNARFLAVII